MKSLTCRLTQVTMVLALVLASPLLAQERSAGTPPTGGGDATSQQTMAAGLKANLVSLTNVINNTCTGGQTHGQTWTIGCGNGFTGSQTLVCIHGQTAVQSSSCQSALPCGSHPSGSEWPGSGANGCPTGTTGTMMYECLNGNIVLDPAATNCQAHGCNGTTYTQNCPTTIDGIQMTGTLTYACTNDNLSLTGNTCHTFGKPCGSTPNGGTTTANCSTYNPQLSGVLTLSCNDGSTMISKFTCYTPTWHTFSISLPESCYLANGAQNKQCNVNLADIRGEVATKLGLARSTPFQNVVVTAAVPYPHNSLSANLNDFNSNSSVETGYGQFATCGGHTGNAPVQNEANYNYSASSSAMSFQSWFYVNSYDCVYYYAASVNSITVTGAAYY